MTKKSFPLGVLLLVSLMGSRLDARPQHKSTTTEEKETSTNSKQLVHIEYGPAEGQAETVEIRVIDAVQATLSHHPKLRQLALDIQIAELEIGRQKARFSSKVTVDGNGNLERVYNELPESSSKQLRLRNSVALSAAVRNYRKSGASFSVSTQILRYSEPGAYSLLAPLTPRWTTKLSGRWLQPLKQGYGYSSNEALIDREEIIVKLREVETREQVLLLVLDVVSKYWALVLRREELSILETNVNEAITLHEIVIRRVRAGQDPRSSLVQAASAVAERRQAVEASRIAIVDAELALLSASYLNKKGKLSLSQIPVPVEKLDGDIPKFSFADELATAMRSRPEVKRKRQEIRLALLDRKIADDRRKYRLDVYAEAGILGLAGTNNVPAFDGGGNPVVQPPDILLGGAGRSTINLVTARAPFFEVGLMLEFPLDNSYAINTIKQAELRLQRVRVQDVETQIALDVRAAMQRVRIGGITLSAAMDSLRLAEQNVMSQKARYNGGGGTLFDVFRSQDEVSEANARIALTRAKLAIALAGLEAAKGTLLQKFGVKIEIGK